MSRLKLFLNNFFLYGFMQVINKVIPFFMLPIYTMLLPDTSSFGISDMYIVITTFGLNLSLLGIYDAMFREYFEKKDDEVYKQKVTSTALILVKLSALFFSLIIIFFSSFLSQLVFKTSEYYLGFIMAGISIFAEANKVIISATTRMKNQNKSFVAVGVANSIFNTVLTVIFLTFNKNYESLVYPLVFSYIFGYALFAILNRADFSFKHYDKKVAKELFKIGLPLMPTFIIYWFLSYFDRVIITNILGNESLGIYAIGAKVASASQIIYMAFSGGWQYFSFSTMQDEDQVALTSRVFEYLGIASFTIFLLLLPFNEILFNYLFKGNFRLGYQVFPYLFLAPLMLMLFQTLNNQLIIIKKGYLITIILSIVALLNVFMTYFFTLYLGIKGSALATLSGYLIAVALILIYLKQNKLIEVKARFLICTFSTLLIVFFNFISLSYLNVYCIIALISFYLFYRKDLKLGKSSN